MRLTQACKWSSCPSSLCLTDFTSLSQRFVKVLVIEIFSSVLGLFGLIIGLLISGKAAEFK